MFHFAKRNLGSGLLCDRLRASLNLRFYGGAALAIGLLLGVVLRAAAIFAPKWTGGT